MCLIPAGHFIMGSDDDLPNEAPAHKIYLDAYYIGKTEVPTLNTISFGLKTAESVVNIPRSVMMVNSGPGPAS